MSNLDQILFEREISTKKDYYAFPIEVLPKSFKSINDKEIKFLKTIIKRFINKEKIKNYFQKDLKLEVDCHLESYPENIGEIINSVSNILEGVVFKNKRQLKSVTIIKHCPEDAQSDTPFIGIKVKGVN